MVRKRKHSSSALHLEEIQTRSRRDSATGRSGSSQGERGSENGCGAREEAVAAIGYVAFYGLGPVVAFTDGADRGLFFLFFRLVGKIVS